jgi:hypothetical protein
MPHCGAGALCIANGGRCARGIRLFDSFPFPALAAFVSAAYTVM